MRTHRVSSARVNNVQARWGIRIKKLKRRYTWAQATADRTQWGWFRTPPERRSASPHPEPPADRSPAPGQTRRSSGPVRTAAARAKGMRALLPTRRGEGTWHTFRGAPGMAATALTLRSRVSSTTRFRPSLSDSRATSTWLQPTSGQIDPVGIGLLKIDSI